MKKFTEEHPDGRKITTSIPEGTPTLAADGFGPGLIGFPLLKLTLVQDQIGIPGSPDIDRDVVGSIQLPTAAFLEMADKIREILADNGAFTQAQIDQARNLIFGPTTPPKN